ncbi:MAG: hypothetical protein AB8B53_12930 [Flavobacteriales bacterium]
MKKALLIFMIFLFPLGFLLFFGLALDHKFNTLPYYHPSELLVLDSTSNELGKTYYIPDFKFTNHDGREINNQTLDDDIYLMAPYSLENEIYLPVITKRLLTANFKYRDETNIKIVGLNSDGIVRSKTELKEYMDGISKNSDETNNYFYLSADSEQEMKSFISEGLGIKNIDNSSLAVLIDTEGQIRGRYNLNAEKMVNDAIEDMALLRKEIDIANYEAEKSHSNP